MRAVSSTLTVPLNRRSPVTFEPGVLLSAAMLALYATAPCAAAACTAAEVAAGLRLGWEVGVAAPLIACETLMSACQKTSSSDAGTVLTVVRPAAVVMAVMRRSRPLGAAMEGAAVITLPTF